MNQDGGIEQSKVTVICSYCMSKFLCLIDLATGEDPVFLF